MFKSILNFIKRYTSPQHHTKDDSDLIKIHNERKELLDQAYNQFIDHTNNMINEANKAIETLEQKLEFVTIKLEVIQQKVSDAIIVENDECKWASANKSSCRTLGISADECIGKNTSEIMKLYPGLTKFFKQLIELENDCLKTHEEIERIIELDSGQKMEMRISPMCSEKNNFIEMVIVGTKI